MSLKSMNPFLKRLLWKGFVPILGIILPSVVYANAGPPPKYLDFIVLFVLINNIFPALAITIFATVIPRRVLIATSLISIVVGQLITSGFAKIDDFFNSGYTLPQLIPTLTIASATFISLLVYFVSIKLQTFPVFQRWTSAASTISTRVRYWWVGLSLLIASCAMSIIVYLDENVFWEWRYEHSNTIFSSSHDLLINPGYIFLAILASILIPLAISALFVHRGQKNLPNQAAEETLRTDRFIPISLAILFILSFVIGLEIYKNYAGPMWSDYIWP